MVINGLSFTDICVTRLKHFLIIFLLISANASANQIFSDPTYKQALEKFNAGEFKQSHRLLKSLDERYPDHPVILNNLGVVSVKLGDIELAERLFERAIATHKDIAIGYQNIRKIYSYRAAKNYRRALSLASDSLQSPEVEFITATSSAPLASPKTGSPAKQVLANKEIERPLVEEPNGRGKAVAAEVSESLQQFVRQWAVAWSNQDKNAYFLHYLEDYQPRPNINHSTWKRRRTERLNAPQSISVKVSKLMAYQKNATDYDVVFHQNYQSNVFSSLVVKRLSVRKVNNNWKIFRERVLTRK